MSKWKIGAIIGMIGLYILGVVSGIVLHRVAVQRRLIATFAKPSPLLRERFLVQALRLALSLSDDQVRQIKPLARRLVQQNVPHYKRFQRRTFRHRLALLHALKPILRKKQLRVWRRLYAKYGKVTPSPDGTSSTPGAARPSTQPK